MRRVVAAVAAAWLIVASVGAGPVSAEASIETGARASILAGVLDAQPAFDPALVDSRSARSNIGRSSLNSVVWPSFLVDAFFFLYGFQSVERVALGVSEARSPQGPTKERATLSDLAFANGGDPDAVPGKAGRSESIADDGAARGTSSIADISLAGAVGAGQASSRSRVGPDGAATIATAEQVVTDLVAGPLRVEKVAGRASVRHVAVVQPSASLAIIDATVAGVPVRIDEEGARATTDALQRQVDAALADSGIEVRVLEVEERGGRTSGHATSGGLLVETRAVADDPTGTPRDVRIGYVFGSARAALSTSTVGAVDRGAPADSSGGFIVEPGRPSTVTTPVSSEPLPLNDTPQPLLRRRVIVTEPINALPVSARGAYGALMLGGSLLLLLRPLVRAGARP